MSSLLRVSPPRRPHPPPFPTSRRPSPPPFPRSRRLPPPPFPRISPSPPPFPRLPVRGKGRRFLRSARRFARKGGHPCRNLAGRPAFSASVGRGGKGPSLPARIPECRPISPRCSTLHPTRRADLQRRAPRRRRCRETEAVAPRDGGSGGGGGPAAAAGGWGGSAVAPRDGGGGAARRRRRVGGWRPVGGRREAARAGGYGRWCGVEGMRPSGATQVASPSVFSA